MRVIIISSILLCIVNAAIAQDFPSPSLLLYWGGSGSAPGQFFEPADIAVATDGTVYVVDRGNQRVQRFTAGGEFLGMWGQSGDMDGWFGNPTGIDVDASGVYVADLSRYGYVQVFAADGTFSGKMILPTYRVAVDGSEIYGGVGDSIFVKSSTGTRLRAFQVPGVVDHTSLYDVNLFPDGRLAVTYPYAHEIFVMDRDGNQRTTWGGAGSLGYPDAVATDGKLVFVADSQRAQIVVLTLQGLAVGAFPVTVPGLANLRPVSLDFNDRGELYVVADSYVVKYAPPTAVDEATWSRFKGLYR